MESLSKKNIYIPLRQNMVCLRKCAAAFNDLNFVWFIETMCLLHLNTTHANEAIKMDVFHPPVAPYLYENPSPMGLSALLCVLGGEEGITRRTQDTGSYNLPLSGVKWENLNRLLEPGGIFVWACYKLTIQVLAGLTRLAGSHSYCYTTVLHTSDPLGWRISGTLA